jgi:long-chain acyl-CoA synthetase
MNDPRLISDALDSAWTRLSSHAAIRDGERELTYGKLLDWSEEISRALERCGAQPRQRVALLLRNSAEFVASFFAIARVGCVAAPLGPQYRSQELLYYLDDLEPAVLITEPQFAVRLAQVMPGLKRRPSLLHVRFGGGTTFATSGDGGEHQRLAATDSPPLVQQYTSGSTGAPKRVVRTHAALLRELEALRATFHTNEGDRFLGVAPFSHVNGMVRTMMSAMYCCGTLYPVAEFKRREVLELVTRERITFLGGVPQIFCLLGQTPVRGEIDLSSIRIAFSSSAPLLPADNGRFCERYGIAVRQLYGSTETGTISFNDHPDARSHLESVGRPISGVRVQVVDEADRPVPVGVEGEFVITSPFATDGYVDNEAATRVSFRGGAYRTGDLGIEDANGYLRLTGRKKFIINRGGFKVNPYEVEAAIRAHPKVGDVVVFGKPSEQGDDVICALVVPSEACTTEELLGHCRGLIADYKIPARISFSDSLPKSATGKVLRAQL